MSTPTDMLPEEIKNQMMTISVNKNPRKLDELFPGESFDGIRSTLRSGGVASIRDTKLVADMDASGNVVALAAAIPKTPAKSEDWLMKNVPDFEKTYAAGESDYGVRRSRINLFHQVVNREGLINNAVKKSAALVAQDGSFKIREVRQGKRPKRILTEELRQLLLYWQENVNSSSFNETVNGSRGIKQFIRRGGRQALIEGDLFARHIWSKTKVPILDNKAYSLPMEIQTLPSADIYVPPEAVGSGFDVFYWKPDSSVITNIKTMKNPKVKEAVNKVIPSKVMTELTKTGMVYLDPALLLHVKNGSLDTQTFGKSVVEPVITDLAYARSLKALDFVTIDSLINRVLVIKIGDPNKDSDYHNLAVAQQRVNTFRRLLSTDLGPNMTIVWAGHDVEKLDMGAHDSLLETEPRHQLAKSSVKDGLGVPDSVLTGSVEGSARGAGWLGFVSLSTVIEELHDEFAQVLTQIGLRIAAENKFEDVDLVWQFNKSLLADKEANSKVMLQAYDRGLLSKRSTIEELGKEFDVERARRAEEKESGDTELFEAPIIPKGPPTGIQGPTPNPPGRNPKKGDPNQIGPDRPTKDKPTKTD